MSATPHEYSWAPTDRAHPTRDNRVSRRDPCVWCGDTKYCLRFNDGGSFCRTIGDAAEWTDKFLGGYLHRATDTTPPTPRVETPVIEAADVDTQQAIYSNLLAHGPLSDAHRALLTGPEHGLNDQQANLYGTLPDEAAARRAIVTALIEAHGTAALLRTPGFMLDESHHIAMIPLAGILMPRRDIQGRLTGFMVRNDKPNATPRYLWFSSASYGGPSSGSAPHLAQPRELRDPRTVVIAEGVKKADLVAERMGCFAISLNGAGSWRAAEEVLDELAARGVDICIIALDRDIKPSAVEHVERSRQHLAVAAVARGYATRIASWDAGVAKGPDDLLIAGHMFRVERYHPIVQADDTIGIASPCDGEEADGQAEDKPPRYGVLTLVQARALPHETLARRHVKVTEQLHASNTYLDLITRVSKHTAIITPELDPTAKRTRPVLTPTDRMCGVNAILGIRAAAKGAIASQPVPMYRAAIAACGTSVGTASSSMAQLARVGILEQAPDEDEEGRRLYALPAIMPHEIPSDNILAFDSPRRSTERRRPCTSCGGTDFERTTRVRVTCKHCGEIVLDHTRSVTLSDHDDDAAADAARASMEPTPPVANCNTYNTVAADERETIDGRNNVIGVAICNDQSTTAHHAHRMRFGTRRQARIGDRAAAHGHRASDDRMPRPGDDDLDVNQKDVEWF